METEDKLNQQKESLDEWAARIDAMPENPDSLAVLGRINRTGFALAAGGERQVMPPDNGNRRWVTVDELAKVGDEQVKAAVDGFRTRHPDIAAYWASSRCACNVAGCDPTGVPECSKGIRERRVLP